MIVPAKRKREKLRTGDERGPLRCYGHLRFIRAHHCSVPGCASTQIEAAHVRGGTDGGMGQKPSDRFTLPICADHHREQHNIGEAAFERRHKISMRQIADKLWDISPARKKQEALARAVTGISKETTR